jgi:hypothetical protein
LARVGTSETLQVLRVHGGRNAPRCCSTQTHFQLYEDAPRRRIGFLDLEVFRERSVSKKLSAPVCILM